MLSDFKVVLINLHQAAQGQFFTASNMHRSRPGLTFVLAVGGLSFLVSQQQNHPCETDLVAKQKLLMCLSDFNAATPTLLSYLTYEIVVSDVSAFIMMLLPCLRV